VLCLRMRGGITIKKLASLGDVKEMPEKLCEYLEKAIEGICICVISYQIVCVFIYTHIRIQTHTHTHTHTFFF
jgi:hypothetical protein